MNTKLNSTNSTNSIVIRIKCAHGAYTAWPVCKDAKRFAALAGSANLTINTMSIIKELGYTIEVEPLQLPTSPVELSTLAQYI